MTPMIPICYYCGHAEGLEAGDTCPACGYDAVIEFPADAEGLEILESHLMADYMAGTDAHERAEAVLLEAIAAYNAELAAEHQAAQGAAVRLEVFPVPFKVACAFINAHHRHHRAPQGWKFGIGVRNADTKEILGVATVGRPVARKLDDGMTLEVTRLCVLPGVKNAASKLYGAARRAAQAMGYARMITYILHGEETGGSLKAAGWTPEHVSEGGSWDRPGRGRADKAPTTPKQRWAATLA